MKFLSLGAGVQSSTIFLMSCYGEIERIDAAIFSDTGWEPQKVYDWLLFLTKEGEKYGISIYTVSNGNIKEDALISQVRGTKKKGKRWASMPFYVFGGGGDDEEGMIKRQCTDEYKIRPIKRKTRELAGFPPKGRLPFGAIEVWKGISIDEKQRAKMSKEKYIDFYYPLIDLRMSRQDCLNWFKKKGLPRPPRSACLGCPFHSNEEWRRIRDETPEEWAQVVEFDKSIRKLGGMKGDTFLHRDRIPLNEVDLRTLKDHGQLSFLDECAGVCGV